MVSDNEDLTPPGPDAETPPTINAGDIIELQSDTPLYKNPITIEATDQKSSLASFCFKVSYSNVDQTLRQPEYTTNVKEAKKLKPGDMVVRGRSDGNRLAPMTVVRQDNTHVVLRGFVKIGDLIDALQDGKAVFVTQPE